MDPYIIPHQFNAVVCIIYKVQNVKYDTLPEMGPANAVIELWFRLVLKYECNIFAYNEVSLFMTSNAVPA